ARDEQKPALRAALARDGHGHHRHHRAGPQVAEPHRRRRARVPRRRASLLAARALARLLVLDLRRPVHLAHHAGLVHHADARALVRPRVERRARGVDLFGRRLLLLAVTFGLILRGLGRPFARGRRGVVRGGAGALALLAPHGGGAAQGEEDV